MIISYKLQGLEVITISNGCHDGLPSGLANIDDKFAFKLWIPYLYDETQDVAKLIMLPVLQISFVWQPKANWFTKGQLDDSRPQMEFR
jgi:hypothetical protein